MSFHFTKVFFHLQHLQSFHLCILRPCVILPNVGRMDRSRRDRCCSRNWRCYWRCNPTSVWCSDSEWICRRFMCHGKNWDGHTGFSGCELGKCELKSIKMLWFLACCGIAAWCKKIALEIAHNWTEDQQFFVFQGRRLGPRLFHPVSRSKQLPAKRLPQRNRSLRQELQQWQNKLSSLRVWNWQWRWKTPWWKFKANVNLISWWNSTRIKSPGRRKKQLT